LIEERSREEWRKEKQRPWSFCLYIKEWGELSKMGGVVERKKGTISRGKGERRQKNQGDEGECL